jgi:hypothetical protein
MTGEIKYKGESFDYYYKQEGSVIAKQMIPIVVDYRKKTFSIRQDNFLLFQAQKVVNQSSQLKNTDNCINRFLYKYNEMVSLESTIVDMYGSNCFVSGTAYWYFITYRFLDVYIHKNSCVDDIIHKIARTDEHYKPSIKLDNDDFALSDKEYGCFLSTLSAFKYIIVNSPQKYTYGTIPLLYYIYMNQCYNKESIIDNSQVDIFCDKVYTYATLQQYINVWINRRTEVKGVSYTKEDVMKWLTYEVSKFVSDTDTTRPNIKSSLPTRLPIPRELQYHVDVRDSRDEGVCKCCYLHVGSNRLVYGHIKPYCDSRNHSKDNIILICVECNKFAGTQDMQDFQKEHYPAQTKIADYINIMNEDI